MAKRPLVVRVGGGGSLTAEAERWASAAQRKAREWRIPSCFQEGQGAEIVASGPVTYSEHLPSLEGRVEWKASEEKHCKWGMKGKGWLHRESVGWGFAVRLLWVPVPALQPGDSEPSW